MLLLLSLAIQQSAIRKNLFHRYRNIYRLKMSISLPADIDLERSNSPPYDDRFDNFMNNRNWSAVGSLWKFLIRSFCEKTSIPLNSSSFPSFVKGDEMSTPKYGLTNLLPLYEAGMMGEFFSKDERYSTKSTFAISFGYVGTEYCGYQLQFHNNTDVLVHQPFIVAVENDVRKILDGMQCSFSPAYVAGRTDRDVSAVSQVLCVSTTRGTKREVTREDILTAFHNSEACREGRLVAFDCQRVPKKFNARSSATWRRYLYLFPLNRASETDLGYTESYDVDVEHVNKILSRLENKELPYNAFAHREDRTAGHGMQDRCTMFKARATIVNSSSGDDFLCIELVGTRFLRRMVRNIVATAVRESCALTARESRGDDVLLDICWGGDRSRAASSAPGAALCLAGVGYDPLDLAVYKFMTKEQLARINSLKQLQQIQQKEDPHSLL